MKNASQIIRMFSFCFKYTFSIWWNTSIILNISVASTWKLIFFMDKRLLGTWDWHQIVIKLGTRHVIYQKLANFMYKRISMSTTLKVSLLAYKCVFYRPENNAQGYPKELNFGGLEMQKWNIPTDRAQRVDEKSGDICVVITFAPGVMVIKMSKIAHFLYFLLMPAKKVTVWRKYDLKRSYLALSENAMDCWILSYHS